MSHDFDMTNKMFPLISIIEVFSNMIFRDVHSNILSLDNVVSIECPTSNFVNNIVPLGCDR